MLGLIALWFSEVGPNRYWLGMLLMTVVAPIAALLERYRPLFRFGPTQPTLDVAVCITLIHLTPQVWFPALIAGGLAANSASVHLCREAVWFYPILNGVFLAGMSFAAVAHDVPNWYLPILAYLACMPSLIFYLRWNIRRHLEMTNRTQRLQNLTLIAGGVAHDFNNILAGIIGYAEIAKSQLPDGHAAVESLDVLLTGTQRAKLLTGQLLSFANRELRSEVDLDLVVEVNELVPLLSSVVKPSTIRVTSSEPKMIVRGDRSQLQQVFMNLILNAAEAMSKREAGVVAVSLSRDSTKDDSPVCVCTVTDSGCGIPAADMQRVFEPFYSSKARGHGLGLACTKRIIMEHGGEIQLDSEPGRGTTVTFRLPAVPKSRLRDSGPQKIAAGKSSTRRLLVVDDEDDVRMVIQMTLRQMGYDVLAVSNGSEAVASFLDTSQQFGAVLLDLKMPGMDGWECRRELQRIRPGVPVILMSGFAPTPPPGDLAARIDDVFLTKPFGRKGLTEALELVLTTPGIA